MCICVYVYMCICVYVYMCMCMYMCMCICAYVYMCICLCQCFFRLHRNVLLHVISWTGLEDNFPKVC